MREFTLNENWRLIYRGSRDGFGAKKFHEKCDGNSVDEHPTLTLFKAKESGFIFGGFTNESWFSSEMRHKEDPKAFIFSLTNRDNRPCKMKTSNPAESICCLPKNGPIFGSGLGPGDIIIADNANVERSFSYLGRIYKHSNYILGSIEANDFLAGSCEFKLEEIEVFERV